MFVDTKSFDNHRNHLNILVWRVFGHDMRRFHELRLAHTF